MPPACPDRGQNVPKPGKPESDIFTSKQSNEHFLHSYDESLVDYLYAF